MMSDILSKTDAKTADFDRCIEALRLITYGYVQNDGETTIGDEAKPFLDRLTEIRQMDPTAKDIVKRLDL